MHVHVQSHRYMTVYTNDRQPPTLGEEVTQISRCESRETSNKTRQTSIIKKKTTMQQNTVKCIARQSTNLDTTIIGTWVLWNT